MYHIVYKITSLLDSKFYIGVHSTYDIDDGYMGSGYRIKDAIKKHGADNFEKQILFEFATRIEALTKEAELVNADMLQNKLCYNLSVGGAGCPEVMIPTRFDVAYKWVFKTQKDNFNQWIEYLNDLVLSDPNGTNDFITAQKWLLPKTECIWENLMNDLTKRFNSRRRNKSAMKLLHMLHQKNLIDCLYVEQIPWKTA